MLEWARASPEPVLPRPWRKVLYPLLGVAALERSVRETARFGQARLARFATRYDDEEGAGWLVSFSLTLEIAGHARRTLVGSGEAGSRRRATLIAASETAERWGHYLSFLQSDRHLGIIKTSSGCAFHTAPDQARLSACLEIVERDPFLTRWYSGLPLACFRPDLYPGLAAVEAFVRQRGGVLRVHHDICAQAHAIVLTAHFPSRVRDDRLSFFCGLGSGLCQGEAVARARKELLRFLRLYLDRDIDHRLRLSQVRRASSEGRLWLYQQAEAQELYLSRCRAAGEPPPAAAWEGGGEAWLAWFVEHHPITFEPLPLPPDLALFGAAVRAVSTQHQVLDYFDRPSVNLSRVEALYGTTGQIREDLHFIP